MLGVVAAAVRYVPHHNAALALFAPDGIRPSRQQFSNPDTATGLLEFIAMLARDRKPTPLYLELVADEYRGRPRQSATFAVGCYWEGERDLGRLAGVVASRTGMVGRDEVVQVHFDPGVIDYGTLAATVQKMSCYRGVRATDANLVADPEQQHYLAMHPEYAYLPLTAGQATKVNAALGAHQDADAFLSPAQLRLKQRIAAGIARSHGSADWISGLRPDRSREGIAAYDDALEAYLSTCGD
jgi:hypothetical protein